MVLSDKIDKNLETLRAILPFERSFDLLQKKIHLYNKTFYLFLIDGFTKESNTEFIRRDILALGEATVNSIFNATQLVELAISSVEAAAVTDLNTIVTALLSGQTVILFDGSPSAAVVDLRDYPTRRIGEPDQEKVLRGAKDGFVESLILNTALIRRRIRDPHLTFELIQVGTISKTDVVIGYMSNRADAKVLKIIRNKLLNLQVAALTAADESLVEALSAKNWLNPLPRAKYTERPDAAATHIVEGKILLIVDNTPSIMILPVGFLDFMQDMDDYYLPVMTGNYLKLVRVLVLFMNLFLTPVYVLLVENPSWIPEWLAFILPTKESNLDLFVQFLFLEVAVDALKIASLNTPNSLGMSLSVIGGLILGEYSIQTGWLIPHAILYMAVVALSSFTQSSAELGYSIKFSRILLLILVGIFGLWGFIIGVAINITVLATTKTIVGGSYLYPLFPFNRADLIALLLRKPLSDARSIENKP
ncbi:spore germination protein [Candidatus Epulonipiscium viviparus]|uniref:spore germination protein n=1 Tax=Candidatus Epulonipiscium viviparus TaxID=420336 RepID=UPI0027380BF8|nr:spore germination protein [Candidatus Epulopiscium viviparus]